MTRGAKVGVGVLAALVVAIAAVLIYSLASGGHVKEDPTIAARKQAAHARREARLEGELTHLRRERRQARVAAAKRQRKELAPASAGSNGTESSSSLQASGASSSSFAQLEGEISGMIGVAYAPLGSTEVQQLGQLTVGHAWSSFKVPIVVTLMLEQAGSLSAEQESLAASAITASDNSAAASLFSDLETQTGGAASQALESVLSQVPNGATQVATAPPPPGAVSSWGQTQWSLVASTEFYGALACGSYGSVGNVLGDMENVIPEQQWGLGQAEFPSGSSVSFKAGWGPDGSESGPYLVRQAGIIQAPAGGAVVTIAAQDSSGSFEAGVSDLDRVADWVAQNVPLTGSC